MVLVHYSSSSDLQTCLTSLQRERRYIRSIVVVDNDAPEPVPASAAATARVLKLPENVGFARAANRGAREGEAPFLLFLNPDVTLRPGALETMLDNLDEPRMGATAPVLLLPDGRAQVGMAGHLPSWTSIAAEHLPGPWGGAPNETRRLFLSGRSVASGDGSRLREVGWVCGACCLIRRELFDDLGGFDERFYLYGEDIDLGKRIGEAGARVALSLNAVADHVHIAADPSVKRAPVSSWLDGLDTFYRKHLPASRRGLHAIAVVGFLARSAVYSLKVARPASPERDAPARTRAYARRSARLAIGS